MKKHKAIKDFQLITSDKKIFILKSGSIIEDYRFVSKDIDITIDEDLINSNPEYFQEIDWKQDLNSYLKVNKIPQPAQISKKLIPFIENLLSSATTESPIDSELRLKRIEKREAEYKEDILNLERREESLRNLSKSISIRESDILKRTNDLIERETNFDRNSILSSEEKDSKYQEMLQKVKDQFDSIRDRERLLEENIKFLNERESLLNKKLSSVSCSINHPDCALLKFKN